MAMDWVPRLGEAVGAGLEPLGMSGPETMLDSDV